MSKECRTCKGLIPGMSSTFGQCLECFLKGDLTSRPDTRVICINCEERAEPHDSRTIVHDGEKYIMIDYIATSPQGPYCMSCVLMMVDEMNKGFSPDPRIEKALNLAAELGPVEGDHHKAYAIDQIVRALTGCPVEKRTIHRGNDSWGCEVQGESPEYIRFVSRYDPEEEFPWEEGIAP